LRNGSWSPCAINRLSSALPKNRPLPVGRVTPCAPRLDATLTASAARRGLRALPLRDGSWSPCAINRLSSALPRTGTSDAGFIRQNCPTGRTLPGESGAPRARRFMVPMRDNSFAPKPPHAPLNQRRLPPGSSSATRRVSHHPGRKTSCAAASRSLCSHLRIRSC
jgi:hypothetical protein